MTKSQKAVFAATVITSIIVSVIVLLSPLPNEGLRSVTIGLAMELLIAMPILAGLLLTIQGGPGKDVLHAPIKWIGMTDFFRVILVKFYPNLLTSRFIRWLENLEEEDRALAVEFVQARHQELVGIRVMHVSEVGNLVAGEMYADLFFVLKNPGMNNEIHIELKTEERMDIFRSIAFHIESAVKMGRSTRKYKKKKDLTLQEQWALKRDSLFLQYILGEEHKRK